MRIGLYLQDRTLQGKKAEKDFNRVLKSVNAANIDLFVFPEHAYSPFNDELYSLNLCDYSDEETADTERIEDIVLEISEKAGCPVIFASSDSHDMIYSYYVNPKSADDETYLNYYVKHIATSFSAFEFSDYADMSANLYSPVLYKGYRIGRMICYDSTQPLFSKAFGVNDVDIIINSTGGHVDYKKWSYYQKVRAIENKCFTLCTMGYSDANARNISYVFGYDPCGRQLKYSILNFDRSVSIPRNLPGNVYIFDINKENSRDISKCKSFENDEYLNQSETINKNQDFLMKPDNIDYILSKSKQIDTGLYLHNYNDKNIIIACCRERDILKPELVASMLYSEKIEKISNKRYIVINEWNQLDDNFYKGVLSNVLKVRAAENFCAVILKSKDLQKCYQVGNCKNSQTIKLVNGAFGIDLSRTTGPEALWKNKEGMGVRKEWRKGYNVLLKHILYKAIDK